MEVAWRLSLVAVLLLERPGRRLAGIAGRRDRPPSHGGTRLLNPVPDRPKLTAAALRRWLPALVRRAPDLVSAYFVPGRVSPRLREATMLGVTSINRCVACERVHQRLARATGLVIDDLGALAPDEAAAHAYGQALAVAGPRGVPAPLTLSARHRRELEASGLAMELANLAGNRFLPERAATPRPQIGGARVARAYDAAMRVADGAGLRVARRRIAGGASGDVLEIGVGTGLNLGAYPPDARAQPGASRPWRRAIDRWSDRACSRNRTLPPGRRTRRLSWRVAATSPTEQRTNVPTTTSKDRSG